MDLYCPDCDHLIRVVRHWVGREFTLSLCDGLLTKGGPAITAVRGAGVSKPRRPDLPAAGRASARLGASTGGCDGPGWVAGLGCPPGAAESDVGPAVSSQSRLP
jgi:hypothetical protein